MDTLRGRFSGLGDSADSHDHDLYEEEIERELPPSIVGQDERRMQVRAYNFWAGLLDNRNFPSVEDLDPEDLPDFGPHGVLLDFTSGIENPGIQFLGDKLAVECGADASITSLADVPSRSLLSRITDHYMQILANQAPIGFEAEFVNQRGSTILYRGILLPFSSDDDTIDFIFGVINWKELADQRTTDELLLEVDQALESRSELLRVEPPQEPWADGPAGDGGILELEIPAEDEAVFAEPAVAAEAVFELVETVEPDEIAAPAELENPDAMSLSDWLASARELALVAKASDDRSRQALYAAVGRAYDFWLAAQAAPEDFAELVSDAGLVVQERAPTTPAAKLVFGSDYDKTRLAEYAAAIAHGQRLGLARGGLADHLARTLGGLKSVVAAERRLRRGESAAILPELRSEPRKAVARRLRKLPVQPLAAVVPEGREFALLVARRMADGSVMLLGEVSDDAALVERVAKQLLA